MEGDYSQVYLIAVIFLLFSRALNGDGLNLTISADRPLSGLICDDNVTFTCYTGPVYSTVESIIELDVQYQWSIDDGKWEISSNTYTMQVLQSTVKVTCEVFVKVTSVRAIYASRTINIQFSNAVPQIHLLYDQYNDYSVNKLDGEPFNLTADIASFSPLTSLYWSPPEYSGSLPYRTIAFHHGNITTTTFMLLKNASVNDSGFYTLTAVNKCGQSSSEVFVNVMHIDCSFPLVKLFEVQPENFTTVEGYTATVFLLFNGFHSLSTPNEIYVLFPYSETKVWASDQFNPDCKCRVDHEIWCSDYPTNASIDYNRCCRPMAIIHILPHVNETGAEFVWYSTLEFVTTLMFVLPSPKVLEPPDNLNASVGSKAVFTCDFEAATDNKISQIHWLLNGNDLAGCSRFKDRINCTVTQQSTDKNYISSTLTIYPVQADNAGQYTCYCSYDTSLLSVGGIQVIESDHKSATLSVRIQPRTDTDFQTPSSSHKKLYIISGTSIGVFIIIVFIIVLKLIHYKFHHKGRENVAMSYSHLEQAEEKTTDEITDEELDQYIIEELFPLWEKLGKALKLPGCFLDDTYNDYPADPAERLRVILREWRAKADNPSLIMLDKRLEQLGFKNLIAQ